MKYTCKMGADIGSIANDKNKTLADLTATGAGGEKGRLHPL